MNNQEVFEGDLIVKPGDVCHYVKITGDVSVREGAKFAAPKLTSVGGYVSVREGAKFAAPKLTSVGGDVSVREGAKFAAPKLTSVGGDVSVEKDAEFAAPKDLKKNDESARIGVAGLRSRCRSALLSVFAAAGFSFADGVLAKIVSQRGPVSRVIICGKTEVSYLVTDGEAYSHGKTLAEARDGLLYKIGSRDTSEFKAWTLDKEVSKRDAIRAYRAITGACEGGVRSWLEQRNTPEKITVEAVIALTKGAYGADSFKGFFGGSK